VTAVLPAMTPLGDVGRAGVQAYAARLGKTEQEYLAEMGKPLTPELAGSELVDLVLRDADSVAPGYLLSPGGLRDLPAQAPPR
jgi:hypothetical protein